MKSKLTINQFRTKFWKLNGKFHRTDGPAVIHPNGSKYWYLNGKDYPQKTWFNLILSRNLK